MSARKHLSLAFLAFTMIGARGAANESTTYANKDLQTTSLPDAELEKDRQPMDTIITLEMEGDVMKLPEIVVPPQWMLACLTNWRRRVPKRAPRNEN